MRAGNRGCRVTPSTFSLGAALGLPPSAARALDRTPMSQRPLLAVVLDAEGGASLWTRGELATWLEAHGLPTLASEARGRHVARGELLLLALNAEGARWRVLGREPKPRRRR